MPTDDADQIARELRAVLGQLGRRTGAPEGLPLPQLSALGRLESEGAMTTSGLAAATGVRPPSMARTVSALLDAGFVKRTPHPDDARAALLQITRSGRTAAGGGRRKKADPLATAISELSQTERQALVRALKPLGKLAAR